VTIISFIALGIKGEIYGRSPFNFTFGPYRAAPSPDHLSRGRHPYAWLLKFGMFTKPLESTDRTINEISITRGQALAKRHPAQVSTPYQTSYSTPSD